jgi:GTP cyclohydrolase I
MAQKSRRKGEPGAPIDRDRAEGAIRELLSAFGLDPDSPELSSTPHTAARAFSERLLDGYRTTPAEALGSFYPVSSNDPVIATRIPLMFVCPHHLMPAQAEAHVAFVPRGRVPGLGRIAKLCDALAHRLILQEDLTRSIADALFEELGAKAVLVLVDAQHLCVAIEDFARRQAIFRTRAGRGATRAISSLGSEIDASLSLAWPTPHSPQPSAPPGSKSPSSPHSTSAKKPKKRTISTSRRPSRSGVSSRRPRSSR